METKRLWSTSTASLHLGSCDSFVALPPVTADGCVIFAKNSDRIPGEVQEVIHCPAQHHRAGSQLQCTYITIEQCEQTHSVILSKPAWCWGAEMGANEHGVSIGNEAVYTKEFGEGRSTERLLGMDLVRIGLERARTAREGLDIMVAILEKYGQGGNCCEDRDIDWTYDNSYLLADRREAWVLDTAGRSWAAQQVIGPVKHLTNCLTITTDYGLTSEGLEEYAHKHGLWSPGDNKLGERLNFSQVFKDFDDDSRYAPGKQLMENLAEKGDCRVESLFSVLRDEDSGICMGDRTTASQVSVLSPPGSPIPCCHWLTATPGPRLSIFKPFIFVPNVNVGSLTVSPNDAADRQHPLYVAHEQFKAALETGEMKAKEGLASLQALERKLLFDIEALRISFGKSVSGDVHKEIQGIFQKATEDELKIYK